MLTRGRRPKACKACHRSKSACDKRQPCDRCQSRQIECSYRQPSPIEATTSAPQCDMRFLLRLTNPAASTMLESFENDDKDPDIDGAAAVATIGWGQAVAQEDDILLWSLSSVLDLHELGLASSHDFGIAGPPASMAELAPIFAPSAFETLEGKIQSSIVRLSSLHGQLLAHNPSYHTELDEHHIKLALSARTVIMFSVVYFQQSHRYISLVHRPSFGSHDTSAALLLAVAFAGSTRSPTSENVMCVRSLARLLEELVFRQLEYLMTNVQSDDRSRELLETLEAAILMYQIQFMSSTAVTLQRTRAARLPALVSAVRKLGLFATTHKAGADWLQFVETESCIRYLPCSFHFGKPTNSQ